MDSLSELLSSKLQKRSDSGALRFLNATQFKCDFYSNDYLGLANQKTSTTSSSFSGSGSRLISGTSQNSLTQSIFLQKLGKVRLL